MNCHQILTGASNAGCNALGSVEGTPFTAYASGCNIVILASNFERIQIIPGALHNYVRISALDCSTDTGKICAAYDNRICVFEPVPLVNHERSVSSHGLDYKWVQTGTFSAKSVLTSLSWNLEGNRLLTGGVEIQLWREIANNTLGEESSSVKFEIGGDPRTPTADEEDESTWECIWQTQTAISVHHMAFSPDGTLFATCGKNDRLVKIWYEHKSDLFPSKSAEYTQSSFVEYQKQADMEFSYIYIAHPRAVTNITWRITSKHMPKGSVSNMLVTSCMDNICRIWVETILPDDGLVNMNQFDPLASQNPKFRTHRHKHRFMQRLKHMKTCFHIRRHVKGHGAVGDATNGGTIDMGNSTIPTLPSTYSVHDFHSYGFNGTGITPALHFHIAASINAETDIPLVPSMEGSKDAEFQPRFILHWLNNKEMHFSMQAENLLHELTKKAIEKDQDQVNVISEELKSATAESRPETDETRKKLDKMGKSYSHDSNVDDIHQISNRSHSIGTSSIAGGHSSNNHTMSSTTSVNSFAGESLQQAPDSLDVKIECLLRDWHHSPDLLFSIHPVDGSFLIWVVEWLDEYHPGAFRQAQVSFSTRIPNAFPLGDAISMSTNVNLYNTGGSFFHFRDMIVKDVISNEAKENKEVALKLTSVAEEAGVQENDENESNYKKNYQHKKESNNLVANLSAAVSMVTNHTNGTLNLWQVTFAEKSKFSQVLSIGHASRVSGHRFRVNDITCHPVLPLLLTTSHHNIPDNVKEKKNDFTESTQSCNDSGGFCSELILWRVDSVGPLSQSGGVSELARINSPEISAFSNVAWIPTLLPSTTLGSLSNSPSACFVASDGNCLRVFQAVIDARTLLAEISGSERKNRPFNCTASLSSESSSDNAPHFTAYDKIKIVSQQSTARPGCILQLDAIDDAIHDWQNTQFLHVFQEQLIVGQKNDYRGFSKSSGTETTRGFMENTLGAIVDLQKDSIFEEPFYIVIIEKTPKGSTIHMWRLIIASHPTLINDPDNVLYVPDSNLTQDLDEQEYGPRLSTLDPPDQSKLFEPLSNSIPHVSIVTTKVCTQDLLLGDGIEVIHAAPVAGHLSSSSIYPACFAPYIIVTACSDSTVRFWKCNVNETGNGNLDKDISYNWSEWSMIGKDQESRININGQPLHISAAYSGRIACAFKFGKSFTRSTKNDASQRFVNLCVTIYECESTGGSEWVLEDTIYLKNINLPKIELDMTLDLSYLHDKRYLQKKKRLNLVLSSLTEENRRNADSLNDVSKVNTLATVPSFSTLQSLRKSITEYGNTCPLTQKHLVQLDWVSKEDGSHILTIAVGSKIMLFTPVSSDLAQANMKAMKESLSANRPILRKASSLAQPHFNDEIRWMKLRQIELKTADDLPPLPMQISWVRDGIFVAGMDSEMHVYSQWKPQDLYMAKCEHEDDKRCIRDEDLINLAQENSQVRLHNVASLPQLSKLNIQNDRKKKYVNNNGVASGSEQPLQHDYMPDYGLFEASRIACPVLPQYHPKQLMELLNSGKIRWVKAILSHLVRCIISSFSYKSTTGDDYGTESQIPEEVTLDYTEISSIPPLPLWILLAAEKESMNNIPPSDNIKDYNDLFDSGGMDDESLDDLLDTDETNTKKCDRRQSVSEKQKLSHFGPRQGQLLSRLLTHTHLPGLSSLDQMHLLALADTVSTCNTDFAERFVIDAAKSAIAKENLSGQVEGDELSTDSLDDCGLRFLLAMKHYNYLLRCLPLLQRNQFQKQGVGTSNIVWAFHSENEDDLLNLIPSYAKGQPKWSTLRELGVGWWVRNTNTLRQCFERLAKAAYQNKQDPLDAALYYIAMKKKSVVWGLFRSKRDEKMTAFFANNFNEDRWRKSALKNAFALLGKQRFDHAVAFFLLANSLNDAIEVCLTKLEDLQLAMVISRLYDGEHNLLPNSYKALLYEEVLGCDKEGLNEDLDKAHPDPFLRSMSLWILKNYSGSLNTLLNGNVGHLHPAYEDDDPLHKTDTSHTTNPNVFNFYVYLRTHPLLIRQHIAQTAQEKRQTQVILSGFSYSTDKSTGSYKVGDKQLLLEDSITPLERQLYFTTAHGHFKGGCPALALEVLSKLPAKVLDDLGSRKDSLVTLKKQEAHSETFDWSTPVTGQIDPNDTFKLTWDAEETEKSDDEENPKETVSEIPTAYCQPSIPGSKRLDIMAQQLKFIACLKILMEELSTLATGFEVDGGQLRYQLYVWLEKEVEAMKHLCNYSNMEFDINVCDEPSNSDTLPTEFDTPSSASKFGHEKPTLHEILLQEKQNFDAKVQRAVRRKRWLKANESLLRTLLSYCSLHGASGGGLSSVRMELILLLQELQQEKTHQQLLSPLPFPTTLPLLSACIAGNKTVIADPVRYLQSNTHDMLQTIISLRNLCGSVKSTSEIFVIQNLAIALSACIYQSLCDSDTFCVKNSANEGVCSPGMETLARLNASCQSKHLMSNTVASKRRRKYSTDEPLTVCTSPSKWPGVTNLRALLAREKDEDIPRLNVLLTEAFVATYMALLVCAISSNDCHILYRLVGHKFSDATWATLFGGGVKKLLRKATSHVHAAQQAVQSQVQQENAEIDGGMWNTVTSSLTMQRVKLNMKLLGNLTGPQVSTYMKEDKPTYREQFLAPDMSMLSYFLMKPLLTGDPNENPYDTADSDVSEEDDDDDEDVFNDDNKKDNGRKRINKQNDEHTNMNSLSWNIMRLAVVKLVQHQLQIFINIAGIEMQELPVSSPLVHATLRALNKWQTNLKQNIDSFGEVPSDFIPGCFIESDIKGPPIHKYRTLLDKQNTPFNGSASAAPARRLWNYLVRQDIIQEVFIRTIFIKKSIYSKDSNNQSNYDDLSDDEGVDNKDAVMPEPMRIIHKDQESISAFCLNRVNQGLLSLATPKELQEIDVSLLLDSPNWLEDECEIDILNLNKDVEVIPSSGFLVVQTPGDKNILNQSYMIPNKYGAANNTQSGIAGQSGRGSSLVLKHKVENIKRMSAHPLMPLYLTGGQDGSVQMWEWGHQQVVCTPRPPGTFAKVTRCRFSPHGNKFGISDGDGNLSLWQVGLVSQSNRSFFTHQCHNKIISDFMFLGSCSLIATAGHSSEGKNVAIWDTLLPQKKSMVTSFSCHDQGASCLVYAPQHQLLISAGKKGDVCLFDMRQRALRHRFQAHENAIKCLAMDPHEEVLITGSADGDIRLWGLSVHTQLHSFPGEHARSSFFKHIGQGVTQLEIDSAGRLFSCGADGSMKVRQILNRDSIVNSLY